MVHVYNCHPFKSQQIVQASATQQIHTDGPYYECLFDKPEDESSFCSHDSQQQFELFEFFVAKVEQEPGLVCCGGGALFVVATGGCKVTSVFL